MVENDEVRGFPWCQHFRLASKQEVFQWVLKRLMSSTSAANTSGSGWLCHVALALHSWTLWTAVTGSLKILNSGGVKLSTCQSLTSKIRGCMDAGPGGIPHVARFIQQRIEHQRDRQKNRRISFVPTNRSIVSLLCGIAPIYSNFICPKTARNPPNCPHSFQM